MISQGSDSKIRLRGAKSIKCLADCLDGNGRVRYVPRLARYSSLSQPLYPKAPSPHVPDLRHCSFRGRSEGTRP